MSGIYSRTRAGSAGSIGEEELIGRIRRWLGKASPPPPAGMGDDCAVLPRPGGRLLLTVDPLIHGIHFDGRVPPAAAGAKLLRRNLSDIAAMGGRPGAAVVALAIDPRVSLAWLGRFHRGLAAEALRWGVPIAGGDVARLPGAFCATLTLAGEAPGRAMTRAGARAGDWIYVTGLLGRSLQSGHHFRFTPRLAEGAWLAGRAEVRSMMDVSDGLAKDLRALTPPGLEAAVFAPLLPRRPGAGVRDALCGGEDYELVFSVASRARRPRFEAAWRKAFRGTRLTCIGRFARGGGRPPDALALGDYHGYEHLRQA
ncbi:MAG TPA: thiamine-phosphate kinase [Opitutaceae bacterium]|jgi:thiamine-monophosphate kinase